MGPIWFYCSFSKLFHTIISRRKIIRRMFDKFFHIVLKLSMPVEAMKWWWCATVVVLWYESGRALEW